MAASAAGLPTGVGALRGRPFAAVPRRSVRRRRRRRLLPGRRLPVPRRRRLVRRQLLCSGAETEENRIFFLTVY